jgi:hypothetical protein
LLASFLVKTGQDGQRDDYFRADEAWWYITLLTIGYMVAGGWPSPAAASPTTTAASRGPAVVRLGQIRPVSLERQPDARGCGVRRPRIERSPT